MKFFLLILTILFLSCERKKHGQISYEYKIPRIVKAEKCSLVPERPSPPSVVPVSNVKKRIAGKAETIQMKSNVFPAKINTITHAGLPKLILQHKGGIKSPNVITPVKNSHEAGIPEIIALEASHFKEKNMGSFSYIKAMHGLKSNEISSIMQDKKGNLWIGTWWGGFSRYDGRFLYNYTITEGFSSDVVNSLFEDQQGNIWISTWNAGINKFDGKSITRYTVKEGLPDNSVFSILQDKTGNMWFATDNGLVRFDGRVFTHYSTAQGLPSNRIRSIMEDSNGQLWVGTYGGLSRFDGQSFKNYTYSLRLDDDTEVSSILEGENGSIWFATNKGLFHYDGQYIEHFTTKGGLSSNAITKITREKNGDIWIATRGGGACIYNGKSFTHLRLEDGLANEIVTSIVEDKWGNIWLGTTAGICKYEGKLFSHVMPVKQQEIESLLADSKGNIWMASGTDSCLNKYDGKQMMRYTAGNGLSSTAINCIYEDVTGNIWLGTWNGVEKFDGRSFTNYSTANGLVDNIVFSIVQDKKGNFWFGTNKGLVNFDGNNFTNYLKPQGLCSESIYAILQDHSGDLWIGNDSGVCKYDGNIFTHYITDNNPSHQLVLGICEDRNNNLWFCTGIGVTKFDGKHFTWYTSDQGLSNNIAKNVIEDTNGNIWIGTINGLNRYIPTVWAGDSKQNNLSSYFKKYTITDGFSGAGTYENSMVMDKQGNIWIGANDRLMRYYPEGDITDTIAPQLQLTGISIFSEHVNWQSVERYKDSIFTFKNGRTMDDVEFNGLSKWYNQPQNLQLAHNNNYITFQFIGITTQRPKEVRYQYILEGFDDSWTSTVQPEVVYNNLPHGKFTFKVKSANSEGYWSDELTYSFLIKPPWWQSTFAYCLYAMILTGIVWMFSRYHSKKLKTENILLEEKIAKRTNELEQSLEERYKLGEQIKSQQALLNERLRISRELHDDIGSTLSSISIYSEVAKKRTEKNENPITILSKIGVASRELIEKMSDIVWSLNLNNENFSEMQHRMQAFAAIILPPRKIEYEFNVDGNSKQVQLTSAQAKNIFLIYKEALHNMAKYANCNTALINFNTVHNKLTMIIRDNGKGFNLFTGEESPSCEKLMGGNGFKNMYVRSTEINGKLIIDSKINAGTTISLIIPL